MDLSAMLGGDFLYSLHHYTSLRFPLLNLSSYYISSAFVLLPCINTDQPFPSRASMLQPDQSTRSPARAYQKERASTHTLQQQCLAAEETLSRVRCSHVVSSAFEHGPQDL